MSKIEAMICVIAMLITTFLGSLTIKNWDNTVELAERNTQLEQEVKELKESRAEMILELTEMEDRLNNLIALGYDYEYVVRVVATECGNEPFEGQMAVAQTIMERSKEKGITPEEVVKEENQYAAPSDIEKVNGQTWLACKRVLLDGEKVTEKPIKFFYAPKYCYSAEHEAREYVMTIGGHRFFV